MINWLPGSTGGHAFFATFRAETSEKTQETNNYRHNEIGTSRGG